MLPLRVVERAAAADAAQGGDDAAVDAAVGLVEKAAVPVVCG
jgi:hypothetical protein